MCPMMQAYIHTSSFWLRDIAVAGIRASSGSFQACERPRSPDKNDIPLGGASKRLSALVKPCAYSLIFGKISHKVYS
jgi:hypothetical protein